MSDMIRTEGENENEKGVDGDDPKDVLEEDEGTVETQKTLPSQFLVGANASAPIHRHRVPTIVLL